MHIYVNLFILGVRFLASRSVLVWVCLYVHVGIHLYTHDTSFHLNVTHAYVGEFAYIHANTLWYTIVSTCAVVMCVCALEMQKCACAVQQALFNYPVRNTACTKADAIQYTGDMV
jgi:hypothetical protein